MSIMRWDPFRDLVSLRDAMDRLFEESFIHPTRLLPRVFGEQTPAIDMYQTPESVVVRATLPGIKPEEVDISILGDTLTIKGETRAEESIKREEYLCQERRYGAFSRSVTLPAGLKIEKAEAAFENGVLTLTIPKAEEAKPKQIKVKVQGVLEAEKKQ